MTPNDFEAGYLAARVEQQIIIDEQVRQIEMLRLALEMCRDDSDELLGQYRLIYSQKYRPERLRAQENIVAKADEALAATKETK
jgi:hypothetical protein